MLRESILQYFRPSLSYHLPLRPLFLCGRLRHVLLYQHFKDNESQPLVIQDRSGTACLEHILDL